MSHEKVMVVVLNYKTPQLTIKCIQSLIREAKHTDCNLQVRVVDNASEDGSAAKITAFLQEQALDWISFEVMLTNGGYAYGNNAPIRRALEDVDPPKYFMLLNPDTELLDGSIQALLDFFHDNPAASIAGSQLLHPDGKPANTAFNFPNVLSELDRGFQLGIITRLLKDRSIHRSNPTKPTQVDWVSGAAVMIKKEVFDLIGLIDESYFLYFEEVDFMLRAAQKGFKIYYVPDSKVIHHCGASTGITSSNSHLRRIPSYWFASRRRYMLKNWGVKQARLADLFYISGMVFNKFRGRTAQMPPYILHDYLLHSPLFDAGDIDDN